MKTKLLALTIVLCSTLTMIAKDMKTVVFTPSPEMHCNSCEIRIKNGLRFEKGVKDIVTNLKKQTILIKYDSDKTNVDALRKAFSKIDYSVAECELPSKE